MKKKVKDLYQSRLQLQNSLLQEKEEAEQFQDEFTMYESKLNLHKFKEAMIAQNPSEACPIAFNFITKELALPNKIGFNDFVQVFAGFLKKQDRLQLMTELLNVNKTNEISTTQLKGMLEEMIGRKISDLESRQIMKMLFNLESGQVSFDRIAQLIEDTS